MENIRKIKIANTSMYKRYEVIRDSTADYQQFYRLEAESLADLIRICNAFDKNVETDVKSVVRMGYYLQKIRDEKMYEHSNCKSVYDFAKIYCGLSRSACGQMIQVAEKFYVEKYDLVGYKAVDNDEKCNEKNICASRRLDANEENDTVFDYRDMSEFSFYKLYEIQSLSYSLITKYVTSPRSTVAELHNLVANLRTDSVEEQTENEREKELLEETQKIESTYNPKVFYNLEYFKRKSKEQLINYIMTLQRTYINEEGDNSKKPQK